MKFHLTPLAEGQNLFTGYGDGYVSINHQRYEHPVVDAPGHEVEAWAAADFETLTPAHFDALLAFKPEVVILGTGGAFRFPRPEVTRPLAQAAVGFEAM